MNRIRSQLFISAVAAATIYSVGCSNESSGSKPPIEPTATNSPAPPALSATEQILQPTNGLHLVRKEQLIKTNGLWYLRGTTNLFSGMELDYHTNGLVKFQMTFTNGLTYGLNTAWHLNGAKQSEGRFTNGKREGLWNMWFDNGKPDKQGMFSEGKPDGLQIFWHTNGVKSVEWYHKEGLRHGKSDTFHKNG